MTPADLDRCRRSWADIQAMPASTAQPMAVVFFAATWVDRLLAVAGRKSATQIVGGETVLVPPLMTTGEDDAGRHP